MGEHLYRVLLQVFSDLLEQFLLHKVWNTGCDLDYIRKGLNSSYSVVGKG